MGRKELGPGLSPRVRGNRFLTAPPMYQSGSIPACAGEPRRCQVFSTPHRVYPRVCGGTLLLQGVPSLQPGLSPRVRGNLVSSGFAPFLKGSIPACAGEPERYAFDTGECRVYPRVCGGTQYRRCDCPHCLGLSPRVRGNLGSWQVRDLRNRSIPACAGEPDIADAKCVPGGVYPRVCGGTPSSWPSTWVVKGLSPRVRGNPSPKTSATPSFGSIPACAGEPRRLTRRLRPGRVYPRVCGGTWM